MQDREGMTMEKCKECEYCMRCAGELTCTDGFNETFDNGATSWTACTTSRWKHCELAKVEDKQKYAK